MYAKVHDLHTTSPDATTRKPDRQSLWLDLIHINDYVKFHQNIAWTLPCQECYFGRGTFGPNYPTTYDVWGYTVFR